MNGEKIKCIAAIALMQEALGIMHALSQDSMAVQTLKFASAHSNLETFDRAPSTLKEALDLGHRCRGEENTGVASCHQEMAIIIQEQAKAIMHMEYMMMNSMHHDHWPFHQQGAGGRAAGKAAVHWNQRHCGENRSLVHARPPAYTRQQGAHAQARE